MHIVILNHYAGSPIHGMEYRPYYLAREWLKAGHDVTIVASSFSHLRRYNPTVDEDHSEEWIDGIRYLWLRTPEYVGHGFPRIRNILAFVASVVRKSKWILRNTGIDLVIASSTYPLDIVGARLLKRNTNCRLVFELHDLWPVAPMEVGGFSGWHPYIVAMGFFADVAYRLSDKIVSILPHVDRYLIRRGVPSHKIVHVPNGVNLDEWTSPRATVPEHVLGVLDRSRRLGRCVVGYVGSHGPANALDQLLDAAQLLRSENVDFVMVGQGSEKKRLIERCHHSGLDNVFMFDAVEKKFVPGILEAMDVLFIGWRPLRVYRYGISPNKLFDYMMAAKPIVHSVAAGNDPVREADCGISVPPNCPEMLAVAIRRLATLSPGQRAEIGQRGRSFVLRHHTYPVLARRFLQAVTE